MSLLSPERLRVGLCPHHLTVVGHRRGARQIIAGNKLSVARPARDSAPWQAAVDALPEALALAEPRKPEVTVVLSNHFVRYALLPWDKTLRSKAEWLEFARHRLAGVYGQAAADWDLQVSETARRGPRIACAVDTALLDALDAKIAASGATLLSVQPYLMVAFNRTRRTIGNGSRWLVIQEPGCLVVALIRRGIWHSVRSRRVDEHWRTALPAILERESAVLALGERCTKAVICTPTGVDAAARSALRMDDSTPAPGTASDDRMLATA